MIKKILRRFLFWGAVSTVVLVAISNFPDRFEDATEAYQNGNFTEAMELWSELAKNGDSVAQHNIGTLYQNGQGVEQSDEEAHGWFMLAAEGGNAAAQFEVGKNFEVGTGTPIDLTLALLWLKKSADEGYPPAQTDIGLKYLLGGGVEQNNALALVWLNRVVGPNRQTPVLFSDHLSDTKYTVPCSNI